MEFRELLQLGKDLKAENCTNIRDWLEMVETFNDEQIQVFYTLIENDIEYDTDINGVYNNDYIIWDSFIDYINNYIDEQYNLPDFVELDYISIWYGTFRYESHLFIDWFEPKWYKIHELDCVDRYIQIFVLGDKYRFFYEHRDNGDCKYYDYNTIDQLRKKVYSMI